MSQKKGFSLFELILGAVLGLLLAGLMLNVLIPVLRYANWGFARAELVQVTARVANRMLSDLQKTSQEGLTLPGPGEPGLLSIHPLVGVAETGAQIWDDQLILYCWNPAQARITRRLWSQGVTRDLPTTPTLNELRSAFSVADAREHILANGLIQQFQLAPSFANSSSPLRLRLVSRVNLLNRPAESYEFSQDFYLRNGER